MNAPAEPSFMMAGDSCLFVSVIITLFVSDNVDHLDCAFKTGLSKSINSKIKKCDFMLERVSRWPGVRCPKPEGAFYLFPDVSAYFGRTATDGTEITGSEALCFYLLEQHGVALVPGQAFGADGGVRVSYASSMEELARGADRIEAGLGALV